MDWYVVFLIVGMFFVALAFLLIFIEHKKKDDDFDEDFKRVLQDKERSYRQGIKSVPTSDAEKLNISKPSDSSRDKPYTYIDSDRKELLKVLRETKPVEKSEKSVDRVDMAVTRPSKKKEEVKEDRGETSEEKDDSHIYAYRSARSLVMNFANSGDLVSNQILSLKGEGLSVESIAKKLGRGVREVEMILRINEKS